MAITKKKAPIEKEVKVEIPAPNIKTMKVEIIGTSPIIYHKWTQKAKEMILKKQMKDPEANKRTPRDPEGEFRASFYYDKDEELAFPSGNIKQAMVGAVRNLEGVTMTLIRGAVFTLGDEEGLIKLLYKRKPIKLSKKLKMYNGESKSDIIIGTDPAFPGIVEIREDMVRVMGGGADVRFRGQVKDWTMEFLVRFNADVLSASQVLNLLQTAGFSCGLGEWRPEKNGDYGTFEIATNAKTVTR